LTSLDEIWTLTCYGLIKDVCSVGVRVESNMDKGGQGRGKKVWWCADVCIHSKAVGFWFC